MSVDTGRLRVVAAEMAASPEPRPRARDAGVRAKQERRSEAAESGGEIVATDFDSPGPYIKSHRRRRGMSLDQLAAATKIPRPQLELIESDRYDELPGMVFAKGFLRCCARTLELDPDTVLGLLYDREAQLRKRRRELGASASTDEGKAPVGAAPGPRSPARAGSKLGLGKGPSPLLTKVQALVAEALERLPSARILMWIVVALLVALVVFIAFTLASSQAQAPMIRS